MNDGTTKKPSSDKPARTPTLAELYGLEAMWHQGRVQANLPPAPFPDKELMTKLQAQLDATGRSK